MENTRNGTIKGSKTKGSWDTILADLKKHFALEPENDTKFYPPRKNELLSSIEARLNKYREEITQITNKEQTENV